MRTNTTDNNSKKNIKMDARCNALGYLVSTSEMSRFTPNLYDDIFIFSPKKKDDAISERLRQKEREQEEIIAQNVEEVVVEEPAPEVVEEVVDDPATETVEVAESVDEAILDETPEEIADETAEVAESVDEIAQVEVIPPVMVVPVEEEQELVVELEPLPVVVLSPIPVVDLEPISVVDLEPAPVIVEEEPVQEEIVESEKVEEVAEVLEEEIAPVAEEDVIEEEVVDVVEETPIEPFKAFLIPSSTEEDAELLKERYKTVPLEKRFERSTDSVRKYYSDLKNEILSYENVKSRMSKKFDTFSIGRFTVAKLTVKNDVVKLYLALANDSIDTKYYTEDVSSSEIYDQTPTLHNVKSKRGLKYGIELINEIMTSIGYSKVEGYEPVDFAAEFAPVPVSKKKEYIADLMKKEISATDCNVITNELAYDMLEIVKSEDYTINKFNVVNKYRIYVDDIAHWFEDGETVTIAKLQEKGALPVADNLFLEVHGRGTLDRKLFVEAHSYDMKAIKMILLTDGEVVQYK